MSGRPVAADEAVKQRSMSDLSFYPNHHYSEVLQTKQKMQGMFNIKDSDSYLLPLSQSKLLTSIMMLIEDVRKDQ